MRATEYHTDFCTVEEACSVSRLVATILAYDQDAQVAVMTDCPPSCSRNELKRSLNRMKPGELTVILRALQGGGSDKSSSSLSRLPVDTVDVAPRGIYLSEEDVSNKLPRMRAACIVRLEQASKWRRRLLARVAGVDHPRQLPAAIAEADAALLISILAHAEALPEAYPFPFNQSTCDLAAVHVPLVQSPPPK